MIFETHQLSGTLDKYIESIFYYNHFQPDHSIERVVPTGHIFLLFELDGIPRNTFDNDTLKPNATFTEVWISGMHKNYLSISAHQNSEMLVVQFKPDGAFPFLHLPINELSNQVIPADKILSASILEIRKQIIAKSTVVEKFQVIEAWLHEKIDVSKIPSEALSNIVKELGNRPVAEFQEVIQNYPNSQKHLISQFKKYCGLTPKVFHRILRFNNILQKIHQQQAISWSHVAYQSGYTDQSHFIKEFKAFSGFNPQEFIKREFNQSEPNFFPLDQKG